MARDENDRPYEGGQGKSLNPELTGDVLSPRWSTDDTDEQPAIQVVGNETYILPPGQGTPQRIGETPRDVLDDPAPPRDLLSGDPRDVLGGSGGSGGYDLGGQSGPHDVLGGHSGAHDVLGSSRDALGGSYETGGAGGSYELGGVGGSYESGGSRDQRTGSLYDELSDSGPHRVRDQDDDNPYLPLDRGYERDRDDDRADDLMDSRADNRADSRADGRADDYDDRDDHDDDRPKRGFLGSGWTDDSGDSYDRRSGGAGEVRRRTRVLLVAAAAVVLVGVGVGWMLTGTSSDDPCAGAQCASAGEVTSPSDEAATEDTPLDEDEEEPVGDPTDSVTDEPTETESATSAPTRQQTRPTREPEAEPTRDRSTAEPTRKPTRAPENTVNDTDDSVSEDAGADGSTSTNNKQRQEEQSSTGDTGGSTSEQPPATTQAPAPTPTQEERRGLFDILFPWA
ncbi:hypothetical protein FAF44_31935 [Nonomuraea sp. MG754425]|uniref:hypothetical protein n=1 Tax=Nonomuraea sp. MG754425 TaxID=2570319 RepID=UPI001F41AC5D|nr:hypothetical protein [Nonomuraea sp. MG754425]MCF6472969.1 hypothetical protein [Nonomuraea sp. MG754425]